MSNSKQYRHRVMVPPRQGTRPAGLDPGLLMPFRSTTVAEISDLVGRPYTMDGGVRPLVRTQGVTVGFALTAKAWPGDNLAIHGGLSLAERDDVLVVDWHGYRGGGGSGSQALVLPGARGLAGVVVDGCWRDLVEVEAVGIPVFGRGEASFAPAKREPGEINVPVSCGGVVVEPGDVVVAGAGGVVVVPHRHVQEVGAALQEHAAAVPPPGAVPLTDKQKSSALRAAYLEAFDARAGIRV
ncbi:MAG: hypothetical protein WD794_08275 [Mycobacteriales bacterium]